MVKSVSGMEEFFYLPNPAIPRYFGRVRSGQSDDYRTPFYKGKSREEVINGWKPELVQIGQRWPSLLEFEIDLGNKVGPLSVMKPLSERMEDIESYYDLISLSQKPISPRAIAAVQEEWVQVANLKIQSEELTVSQMKLSTNSGSPYFTKRSHVTNRTLPIHYLRTIENETFMTLNDGVREWKGCAILGWRGQEGGPSDEDVKQRVIWMFPFAVNIEELKVYQPLIKSFQFHDSVPAWVSMEAVDLGVTRLFDTKEPNDLIVCTDFSKFDQHFNKDCQNVARDLLMWLFSNDPAISKWIEDVFPIKYNIPLLYDWGKLKYGDHGMGSGSGGTNADETLVHRCLQHEAALDHGKILNPHSQCLGDDGIISFPGCSVNDIVRTYTSHGLEMNLTKQYASTEDLQYLRRWHHTKYRVNGVAVGVYSTLRALGRLLGQERYYDPDIWGPKMVALRQLSILENVKYHPLNEQFVNYCMKGDKYRLGLDIPDFFDNLVEIANEAIDVMPDFLGYTKSMQGSANSNIAYGIEGWWIVRYLKSLR